jgi:hypothetical protein
MVAAKEPPAVQVAKGPIRPLRGPSGWCASSGGRKAPTPTNPLTLRPICPKWKSRNVLDSRATVLVRVTLRRCPREEGEGRNTRRNDARTPLVTTANQAEGR